MGRRAIPLEMMDSICIFTYILTTKYQPKNNYKLMQEKGFFEYIKECLTLKYKDFSGRTRRREFWSFWLFCFVINNLVTLIDKALDLYMIPSIIVGLAFLLPSLACGVRRIQDVGKPWQYILWVFVPFGVFYLIYLWAQDSQPGENAYGPNPKGL